MLTALETGVKGGVRFTLIDKAWTLVNLSSSFRKLLENDGAAGVDHVSVDDFARNLDANLKKLTTSLGCEVTDRHRNRGRYRRIAQSKKD